MTPLEPAELVALGYHTVIVATPDLQGRLVGRRVPARSFDQVVEDGVDICLCVFCWDLTQGLDLIESGAFALCGMHNGVPDMTLLPDLATLRPAAWLSGVAICLADPVDKAGGEPIAVSPRVQLRRQVERLQAAGLRAQTGTELEFYLFRNEPGALREAGFTGLRPTTVTPADFMIAEGNAYEPFFSGLRDVLDRSGIEMEAAQSEWGTGQWEMTFRYADPLEMADRHSIYKLAVRDVAAAAGMSATFMAKPLDGQPGSSCHVHLSLLGAGGEPTFWADDEPVAPALRAAIGGVLEHLGGFTAWYAPTVNSYRRTGSTDVAGWGRTWGEDNRTTSVRLVGHRPRDRRLEFRLPGADTNPYLTLAALLASVRDGIATGADPGPATTGNGYERAVDPDLPRHLGDAARAFAASGFVAAELGKEVVDHYGVLLDHEWSSFLSAVSDWDLRRYFDKI